MPKPVKIMIVCGYAFLLFQYLRISLTPVTPEIDIEYVYTSPVYMTKKQKLMRSKKYYNISTFFKSYKRLERFETDLKFVLKYTNAFLHYPTPLFAKGQRPFIENNCTYFNCYLTTNKNLFNDLRHFDAMVFDVENTWDGPAVLREPYQKFIFMASESAMRFPLCDSFYDEFYNLTWTYRLDSDLQRSYFSIVDKKGNYVGPRINISWITSMKPTPLRVKNELRKKKKAAAWFISNCHSGGGRNNVSIAIMEALAKYNLTVDIYGHCGKHKCPKNKIEECLFLLKSDYYFYLAFENSVCADYVTEKVLYPLQNYAVPIVYGGANYSRFLPPGSYINAYELNATQVVNEMMKAIRNTNVYEDYFRWNNYYSYVKNTEDPDVCHLCKLLNEWNPQKRTWYKHFREWWNPEYFEICTSEDATRLLMSKPDPKYLNSGQVLKEKWNVEN